MRIRILSSAEYTNRCQKTVVVGGHQGSITAKHMSNPVQAAEANPEAKRDVIPILE